MITLGICLIYYGLALFLYQVNGWLTDGRWTPFPVSRAWEAFFGAPLVESSLLRFIGEWFLSWPLSIALALTGCLLVALVFATRTVHGLRRDQLRQRWLAEQAVAAGYPAWTMPKVLTLGRQIRAEEKAKRPAR